jgi:carboxylesterase type B
MLSSLALVASVALAESSTDSCFGYGCTTVELSVGAIRGNVWSVGEEYLAIPYASASRFEPPTVRTNLTPDNTTFDATNILGFGQNACIQGPYTEKEKEYGVEDCLILNLYKPLENSSAKSEPRPILIWIFGGDNSASEIIPYNATMLAG